MKNYRVYKIESVNSFCSRNVLVAFKFLIILFFLLENNCVFGQFNKLTIIWENDTLIDKGRIVDSKLRIDTNKFNLEYYLLNDTIKKYRLDSFNDLILPIYLTSHSITIDCKLNMGNILGYTNDIICIQIEVYKYRYNLKRFSSIIVSFNNGNCLGTSTFIFDSKRGHKNLVFRCSND